MLNSAPASTSLVLLFSCSACLLRLSSLPFSSLSFDSFLTSHSLTYHSFFFTQSLPSNAGLVPSLSLFPFASVRFHTL